MASTISTISSSHKQSLQEAGLSFIDTGSLRGIVWRVENEANRDEILKIFKIITNQQGAYYPIRKAMFEKAEIDDFSGSLKEILDGNAINISPISQRQESSFSPQARGALAIAAAAGAGASQEQESTIPPGFRC
jgi:hypothetical protein